jgi:hypothetical protein
VTTSPLGNTLRAGDVVEVRSEEEILATLDTDARLGSLPFMPEMLRFCGQQFRVYKRADKTCDTIEDTGNRRMQDSIHLEGLRCDGSGHGGCQAGCLLFWKEAWLKPVQGESTIPAPVSADQASLADIDRATRAHDDGERYSCQATELYHATSPLRWWDPRQYLRDVRSGNIDMLRALRGLLLILFNKFQGANQRYLPRFTLVHRGIKYPFIEGKLRKTPMHQLDLRPGDVVEVKSKDEILATLDVDKRNRGLSFDREMLRYCGRRGRVRTRVERLIDEKSGRMINLKSDCIILEGMYCHADYHQFCPRATYHYWREIWLRRV